MNNIHELSDIEKIEVDNEVFKKVRIGIKLSYTQLDIIGRRLESINNEMEELLRAMDISKGEV